jgi:hypothetical protein
MASGKVTSSRIMGDIERTERHIQEKVETIDVALEAMHFIYIEDYEGKPDIGYDLYDERLMWYSALSYVITAHNEIEEFFE